MAVSRIPKESPSLAHRSQLRQAVIQPLIPENPQTFDWQISQQQVACQVGRDVHFARRRSYQLNSRPGFAAYTRWHEQSDHQLHGVGARIWSMTDLDL